MPRCDPERPAFTNGSEKLVWDRLRDQLGPTALLLSNLRITDHDKDHEADVVVAVPGAGVIVVEVKGGSVWHTGAGWQQHRGGEDVPIDPVGQARSTQYALRAYIEADPRWQGRSRVRWAHAVALPNTTLPHDFSTPDCPRWAVVDRSQLDHVGRLLADIPRQQDTSQRHPGLEDLELIALILRGRGLPQRDVVAIADGRDADVRRLTEDQAGIIAAIQLLTRVEIRGGAGSGKTWLALEQAKRLGRDGQRVALLCYSRGLAAFLGRAVASWPRRHRPAYVGEFHGLGRQWGADEGADEDTEYWENRLPAQMVQLAAAQPPGRRFDAVVIDEAQDFADAWWPVVLASLRDDQQGGIYAFTDEGQRVFARFGRPPVPLIPLILGNNLRNTKPIAESFNGLTSVRMRLLGGEGPAVRFVPCAPVDTMSCADDEVDALFDQGWRAQDIALLSTGSRHPEQVERQALGQDAYWDSFWDNDSVFYGHVLGFKGLERRAVVLAVNETTARDRSRERLYVGLSRARDQLVVCGDPALIEEIGGAETLRRLAGR